MERNSGLRPICQIVVTMLVVAGIVGPSAAKPARALPMPTRAIRATQVELPAIVEATPGSDAIAWTRRDERREASNLLVGIERSVAVTSRPGGGRVIGRMPEASRFYGQAIVAWVLEVSADGRYGLVPVPYAGRDVTGWIRLRGLDRDRTRLVVRADLSQRQIEVLRGERVVFRAAAAIGAPESPTPVGRYFVTDRVAFPGGGPFGTFAFGISGIQSNLPPGWTGGDQLAIHGTNAPGTIGSAASAGCLRVSERTLARLGPLLRAGTPVVIAS